MRLFYISLVLLYFNTLAADKKEIFSPDKKIKLTIEATDKIYYSISYVNKSLLLPSAINMILENGTTISGKISLEKSTTRQNQSMIISPVPEKRKHIPDIYTEITIRFQQPFSIVFRVYNDGVAYRFLSHFKDSITIRGEIAELEFPANHPVYFSEVVKRENADIYHTSFEEPYQLKTLDSITPKNIIFSPILVAPADGPKIVITESDLEDYPGMFITGTASRRLEGALCSLST